MKKNKLIERLNGYFKAEEAAIHVPPIEEIKAYNEFQTPGEPAAAKPARGLRRFGRLALIAACLAVAIVVTVGISLSVSRPEGTNEQPQASDESVYGGQTNKTPGGGSRPPAANNGLDEMSEGIEATDPDGQEEPGVSSMEAGVNPDQNGDGMGDGWEEFEAYFPEELYNLYTLSYIVTREEIYAAESKLRAENEYYQTDLLPPLYLVIRELNIGKEAFVRVNEKLKKLNEMLHTEQDVYTDEQIEWLFSDADIQTLQAALKRDTALFYNGRLYNPSELLRLEDSLLREMANTKEMTAYLANLDGYWFAEVLKHRLEESS